MTGKVPVRGKLRCAGRNGGGHSKRKHLPALILFRMERPDEDLTAAMTSDATRTIATPKTPLRTTLSSTSSTVEEGRFIPGTLLAGRYRIVGLLGKGGMGEVYRATDLTLGQSVALKFLPASATEDRFLLERFHGEVRIARQISHPNVCRVYDIGEAEGMPYISMEYVDGEDLASLLPRIGRLPGDRALATARKICAGLAAAHAKGVIHRDLKPQNIMMDKRGEIVIMDFGLAAIADQLSGAEARNGTPAYMSPEQLKGTEVTARSDIYALGLVLYEIFTGRRPFEAKTVRELIAVQESGQLTTMSSIAADVDPAVERAIRRCLEADPAKRPENPLAVSAALPGGDPLAAALAAGETPSPELVAASGKTEGMERKYAWLCLAVVLACLIAVPVLKQQKTAFLQAPLDYTPEVLKQKARDTAVGFGYSRRPVDTALIVQQRMELVTWLGALPQPRHFKEWLAAEAPASAVYREGQAALVAQPDGDVTETNPPLTEPGSIKVELDFAGRLREFFAIPYADATPAATPVSLETVFHAAGLDPTRFAEVPPVTLPTVPTDTLRAWKGPHPVIPKFDLHVEAGWWRGRLTYLKIVWPWTGSAGGAAQVNPLLEIVQNVLATAAFAAGLFFAVLMASRNWRAQRADRRGAFVVGSTMFVFAFLAWMTTVHVAPTGRMVELAGTALFMSVATGTLFLVLYLALEPAVRVRWPHALITWGRVLSGRWTDAQVGSDLLIGLALGGVMDALAMAHDAATVDTNGLTSFGGLYYASGARYWLAGIVAHARGAMNGGLIVFFGLFGLRVLLRKDWIAALVGGIAFSVMDGGLSNSAHWQSDFAVLMVVYIAISFVLLRFGMVVTVAAVFSLNTFGGLGLGTDWSAWYAPTGFATVVLVLVLTAAAFRFTLGERELL